MTTFRQWADKEWPGLHDWMRRGVRGASAETIVSVVCGVPMAYALSAPGDASDLARCVALLESVPKIRKYLGKLRRIPAWRPWLKELAKP